MTTRTHMKTQKYHRFRDHCHYTDECRGSACSICKLNYNIHQEITIIFYKRAHHYYHFIIIELPEEFKGQFSY